MEPFFLPVPPHIFFCGFLAVISYNGGDYSPETTPKTRASCPSLCSSPCSCLNPCPNPRPRVCAECDLLIPLTFPLPLPLQLQWELEKLRLPLRSEISKSDQRNCCRPRGSCPEIAASSIISALTSRRRAPNEAEAEDEQEDKASPFPYIYSPPIYSMCEMPATPCNSLLLCVKKNIKGNTCLSGESSSSRTRDTDTDGARLRATTPAQWSATLLATTGTRPNCSCRETGTDGRTESGGEYLKDCDNNVQRTEKGVAFYSFYIAAACSQGPAIKRGG